MRKGKGLRQVLHLSHLKPGAHHLPGHVGLRLLNMWSAPESFEMLQDTPPLSRRNGTFFSRKKFSIASAVRVSYGSAQRFTSETSSSILTWTYHAFDKLKVIVMGNGNDVLGR
jgi:hypothetical protein